VINQDLFFELLITARRRSLIGSIAQRVIASSQRDAIKKDGASSTSSKTSADDESRT
jgi:hypothetical protein